MGEAPASEISPLIDDSSAALAVAEQLVEPVDSLCTSVSVPASRNFRSVSGMVHSPDGLFIILNEDDAKKVRGETSPGHTLEPRLVHGGRFIISERVLLDPAHALHIPFLQTLPRCRVLVHEIGEDGQEVEIDETTIVQLATGGRIYTPVQNAWDRPPLPAEGEWNESALFEAVGRAITAWETFERSLMLVYTAILSPTLHYLPLERAYGSVMAFTARLEMVRSAAEARFYRGDPSDDAQTDLNALLTLAAKLSARRNEIAHGVVKPYDSPAGPVSGVMVLPPDYAKNKHGLRDDIDPKVAWAARFIVPVYAYGCPEILFFRDQFAALSKAADQISLRLGRVFSHDAF